MTVAYFLGRAAKKIGDSCSRATMTDGKVEYYILNGIYTVADD